MLIIISIIVLLATIKLFVETDYGRYKLEEKVHVEQRPLMPKVYVYEKINMSLSDRIMLYALMLVSIVVVILSFLIEELC